MERDGGPLDPDRAADALAEYVAAGFDSFDMADHYGSAEDIVGRLLEPPAGRCLTAHRVHQMVPSCPGR